MIRVRRREYSKQREIHFSIEVSPQWCSLLINVDRLYVVYRNPRYSIYSNGIPRSFLRGFQVLAKSVSDGTKFRNTLSACGGDRNFEDITSLLASEGSSLSS
jgi:hypothetical protein